MPCKGLCPVSKRRRREESVTAHLIKGFYFLMLTLLLFAGPTV